MKLVAKVGGVLLASMLMMGMALVGNASAALLWLVCLKGGTGLTKYTSSKCNEASGTGVWQSEGLAAGQTQTVKLAAISILLKDTGISSAVLCFSAGSKGEGVIEAGGKGKIRVATYENAKANCRGTEGCEKEGIETVTGINLPWRTEAVEGTNGKPLTKILFGITEKEPPGWEVVCKTGGIKKTDKCTSEAGHPEEAELVSEVTGSELLVKSRFQQVGEGSCTLGGAKAAKVLGLLAILLPGGALSINR